MGVTMRRRPVIVAGLLWVLLAGAAGCTADEPSPHPSPSVDDTGLVTGSVAPDGGQVRVVESGYTAAVVDDGVVTFGAVLENTSKERAAGVAVTARFFDSKGDEVRFLDSGLNSRPAVILPGERMGFGDQFDLGHIRPGDRAPARMDLKVRTSSWWPGSRVARVVVSDVRHTLDGVQDVFSFTVDSGLDLSAGVQQTVIIVRDRAGKMVGGLVPSRPLKPWPPGRSTQRVVLPHMYVPKSAVLAQAEVYVGNSELVH
jgi:hypothetical protein